MQHPLSKGQRSAACRPQAATAAMDSKRREGKTRDSSLEQASLCLVARQGPKFLCCACQTGTDIVLLVSAMDRRGNPTDAETQPTHGGRSSASRSAATLQGAVRAAPRSAHMRRRPAREQGRGLGFLSSRGRSVGATMQRAARADGETLQQLRRYQLENGLFHDVALRVSLRRPGRRRRGLSQCMPDATGITETDRDSAGTTRHSE
jgi:hypothetical protein